MRRLLALTPYSVVPPRYGGPLRVYNLLRQASAEFAVTAFAQQVQRRELSFPVGRAVKQVKPNYAEYASRGWMSYALYGLSNVIIQCPPVWQSWLLHAKSPAWLRNAIRQADVIQVEHPWQFDWVSKVAPEAVPIVLGTQNVESDLYAATRMRAPRRLAERISKEIHRQERAACERAAHVIAVSEVEREVFINRFGLDRDRVSVVPNGVDCERFQPPTEDAKAYRKNQLGLGGRSVVVFSGSGHPPNIEAAQKISEWALSWPDSRTCFVVAGGVGRSLRVPQDARLRVTGPVEDVKPFLEAADVAVNPMMTGGGTNLKQLEFMAMGLPVVSTPIGSRGLNVVPGRDLWVGDIDQIPALLLKLLSDTAERARLTVSGREVVERTYSWKTVGDAYRSVLRGLAG